jgi:hypothetical protein
MYQSTHPIGFVAAGAAGAGASTACAVPQPGGVILPKRPLLGAQLTCDGSRNGIIIITNHHHHRPVTLCPSSRKVELSGQCQQSGAASLQLSRHGPATLRRFISTCTHDKPDDQVLVYRVPTPVFGLVSGMCCCREHACQLVAPPGSFGLALPGMMMLQVHGAFRFRCA